MPQFCLLSNCFEYFHPHITNMSVLHRIYSLNKPNVVESYKRRYCKELGILDPCIEEKKKEEDDSEEEEEDEWEDDEKEEEAEREKIEEAKVSIVDTLNVRLNGTFEYDSLDKFSLDKLDLKNFEYHTFEIKDLNSNPEVNYICTEKEDTNNPPKYIIYLKYKKSSSLQIKQNHHRNIQYGSDQIYPLWILIFPKN